MYPAACVAWHGATKRTQAPCDVILCPMPITANFSALVSHYVRRPEHVQNTETNSQETTPTAYESVGMTPAQRMSMALRLDIEAGDLECFVVDKKMYTAEVKTSILARLQARTMTNLSAVDRRDAALLSFQGSARHVPGDSSGDTSGDGDRRDLEGRLSGCLQADVLLAGAAELGPLDGPDQGVTKVLKTESEKVSRRGTSATVPHVYIYRDIRACNRAGW